MRGWRALRRGRPRPPPEPLGREMRARSAGAAGGRRRFQERRIARALLRSLPVGLDHGRDSGDARLVRLRHLARLQALEVPVEGADVRVPLLALFGHHLAQNPAEPVGEARLELPRVGQRVRQVHRHDERARRALVRSVARHEVVEGRAERVDVRARVDVLQAADLLGRDVLGRSDGLSRLRQALVLVHALGDAEVHELQLGPAGEHEVVRLDVAVDDPERVRDGERAHRLAHDLDRVALAEPPALQKRAEGLAVHVLHREVVDALDAAEVVDLDDVGVVQARGRAGFLQEPLHEPLVRRKTAARASSTRRCARA